MALQVVDVAKANPMFLAINVQLLSSQEGALFSGSALPIQFAFSIPREIPETPFDPLPHTYYYWLDGDNSIAGTFVPSTNGSAFHGFIPMPAGTHQLTIRVAAARAGELIHYYGETSVNVTVVGGYIAPPPL